MKVYGKKKMVYAYVEPDVYETLCKEKGAVPMSAFLRSVLGIFAEMVQDEGVSKEPIEKTMN